MWTNFVWTVEVACASGHGCSFQCANVNGQDTCICQDGYNVSATNSTQCDGKMYSSFYHLMRMKYTDIYTGYVYIVRRNNIILIAQLQKDVHVLWDGTVLPSMSLSVCPNILVGRVQNKLLGLGSSYLP